MLKAHICSTASINSRPTDIAKFFTRKGFIERKCIHLICHYHSCNQFSLGNKACP